MAVHKIIASNITNLTDARYFAAQDVDFVLFDLNQLSLYAILEMIDWITGPEILLLCSEKSIDSLDEAILKINPLAVGSWNPDIKSKIRYLESHVRMFTVEHNEGEGFRILLDDKEYLPCPDLKEVIKIYGGSGDGIILKGEVEEATGLKSFDELDNIFQWIHDNII